MGSDDEGQWVANFNMSIDGDQVLDNLSDLDPRELVRLIKELDRRAQSWDVTLPLCEHFAKLRVEYAKEHRADEPNGCADKTCIDCYPPAPTGDDGKEGERRG